MSMTLFNRERCLLDAATAVSNCMPGDRYRDEFFNLAVALSKYDIPMDSDKLQSEQLFDIVKAMRCTTREADERVHFERDSLSIDFHSKGSLIEVCLLGGCKLKPDVSQISGNVSYECLNETEFAIVATFFDIEDNLINRAYRVPNCGRFSLEVPFGAHCVDFALAGYEGQINLSSMNVYGVLACCDPITPENREKFTNGIVKRFEESFALLCGHIPDSNGSRYYDRCNFRIGIITDDFMYNYYSDAVTLVYISPSNYERYISEGSLDLLLYVSCWQGLNPPSAEGDYEYDPKYAVNVVPEIFSFAKRNGITTVFQSIEDPPSYKLFLPIAKAADFIFTSAVEMIPSYVEDTGNPYVFYQPYGVNPSIHNPIGFLKKRATTESFYKDAVFFAGSWYRNYPERCKDTALLFDSVLRESGKGLIIADRALYFKNRANRTFPAEYNEFIMPPIDHKLLQKAHKLFDFSLNLNSIKDSETMGAMRVYEVQALGCLLISNYAKSTENCFPDIPLVTEPGILTDYFSNLSDTDIVAAQVRGIRRVMSGSTVYDRLNLMFEKIGAGFCFPSRTVYVVCKEPDENMLQSFNEQTYDRKVLVNLQELRENWSDTDYVIFLDDVFPYAHYLEDAINAFKYCDVDFVEYCSRQDYERGYDYIYGVPSSVENTVFSMSSLSAEELTNGLARERSMLGFAVLAVD